MPTPRNLTGDYRGRIANRNCSVVLAAGASGGSRKLPLALEAGQAAVLQYGAGGYLTGAEPARRLREA